VCVCVRACVCGSYLFYTNRSLPSHPQGKVAASHTGSTHNRHRLVVSLSLFFSFFSLSLGMSEAGAETYSVVYLPTVLHAYLRTSYTVLSCVCVCVAEKYTRVPSRRI